MRTSHFLTSFSIGAALTACTPTNDPDPEPEPLVVAQSFEVTATIAYPPGTELYGLTTSERLVLRLDDAPNGSVTAVWGASLGSDSGTFQRTDTRLSLRERVELWIASQEPDSFDAAIAFEALTLDLIDSDEDGDVDRVEGTGTGTFSHVLGDVQFDHELTVTLSGTPDETPPTLAVAGDPAGLNVLDRLRIAASEPLHPDTNAVVRYGDTRIVLEPFPGDDTHVRSFATGVILPFGTELSIEFTPAPQDLAGLPSENAPTSVRTMDGPGVFAEDGFEADLAAVNKGAELVFGVGTLPAISGTRSLLIEPGDTLTMRLPLTSGDTHLRYQVRVLYDDSGYTGCSKLGVRAGFPGLDPANDVYNITPLASDEIRENTGDERWITAGPVTTSERALPAGAAGEVIFDGDGEPFLPGPLCPDTALLIDDLRIE